MCSVILYSLAVHNDVCSLSERRDPGLKASELRPDFPRGAPDDSTSLLTSKDSSSPSSQVHGSSKEGKTSSDSQELRYERKKISKRRRSSGKCFVFLYS